MAADQLLTIDEAAHYLNVSKTSLRRWTKLGKLSCIRMGVRLERRFYKDDLDKLLVVASDTQMPLAASGADASVTIENTMVKDTPVAPTTLHHVALYFHDRDELWRLFYPYVADHFNAGAPLVYIHEEHARADVIDRMRSSGWDSDHLAKTGLLTLMVPAEAYLRTGTFVPERMVDFIEAAILNLRAAGHDKILIAGEMTWYLSDTPGVEGMIEYEHLLNDMLCRYPQVTLVCQYDLHRLSGAVALGGLCSHPLVQLPDRLAPGFFSFPAPHRMRHPGE